MVSLEYRNAYSEVLEILKYISKEDFEKLPNNLINFFKDNANKDYVFFYNSNKTLQEQNVSKTARYIIALLFRDYWATQTQKEKILAKEKHDLNMIEEEKRQKYNSENIFNNNVKIENDIEDNENINNVNQNLKIEAEKLELIEYKKETIWDKIKSFLGI